MWHSVLDSTFLTSAEKQALQGYYSQACANHFDEDPLAVESPLTSTSTTGANLNVMYGPDHITFTNPCDNITCVPKVVAVAGAQLIHVTWCDVVWVWVGFLTKQARAGCWALLGGRWVWMPRQPDSQHAVDHMECQLDQAIHRHFVRRDRQLHAHNVLQHHRVFGIVRVQRDIPVFPARGE